MFARLLSGKAVQASNDEILSKRRYARREKDKCITIIDGTPYPVENWSLGGLLIQADSRTFGMGEQREVTLKFKMRDRMVDVPHRATVVRKSKSTVAFEFEPLTRIVHRKFQNIISEYVTGTFADSQVV